MQWKKFRKTYFRCTLTAAIALFCEYTSAGTWEELLLWREEIVADQSNIVSKFDDSQHLKVLVEEGPNALPVVFTALRDEEDDGILRSYIGLIGRLSRIQFFSYYPDPDSASKYAYDPRQGLPLLNEEVDEFGIPTLRGAKRMQDEKQQLLQFWAQRDTFLNRPHLEKALREITGATPEEWWEIDRAKNQDLRKIHVYGIYNLPYMFDVIAEDNNAVLFAEFIRLRHIGAFNALHLQGKLPADARVAHAAYPTLEAKAKLICDWWDGVKSTYTELEDLHAAIDSSVDTFRSILTDTGGAA